MATALDPAHTRQPIPVLTGPVPTEDAEQISALLSLFDESIAIDERAMALASSVIGAKRWYSAIFDINPIASPHAEYAARLWASAKQLRLEDVTHEYEPDAAFPHGSTIRVIRVTLPDRTRELVHISWPQTAKPAPVVVAEPATNVIPLPVASPSNDASDDASIRFSLLEVD